MDESPNLSKQFGVMSIPTMILFKAGKEVDRINGAIPEEAVKEFASK